MANLLQSVGQNLGKFAKGTGTLLGETYAPNYMQQQRLSKGRQQAAGIIGQPQQAYQMSEGELFPGEQPIQGLQTAGTGLMGGQMTPEQAYAQLLTIPGYEQMAAQGLMQQQQQQYGASQAELDRQNALALQRMRGQQAMTLAEREAQLKGQGAPDFKQYQTENAAFGNRMVNASQTLDELQASGFDPSSRMTALGAAIPSAGLLTSPQYKQYQAAKTDWITANVRKESGAEIKDSEFDREDKKYFPQPGDDAATVEYKRRLRQEAEMGMVQQSGGAYGYMFPEQAQKYQQYQQQYGGKSLQDIGTQQKTEAQRAYAEQYGLGPIKRVEKPKNPYTWTP